MSDERISVELMKSLMTPEAFAAWERQQEVSREFWRTLKGPAQRPLGSNADEWNLYISENLSATFLAVQIAEAIEDAERRGYTKAMRRQDISCEHVPCACVDVGITTGVSTCDFSGSLSKYSIDDIEKALNAGAAVEIAPDGTVKIDR